MRRRQFEDRPAEDQELGPARAVDIRGRCADCWGPVSGTKDSKGGWNQIECYVCRRSVGGDDAAKEAEDMWREADGNMAATRVGRPAKYRAGARFVLKLLPDMDRDTEKVGRRIQASLAKPPKPRRLTRREVPSGTAGFLYAQAQVFLSGVQNLSPEMSAIPISDFEFGEPRLTEESITDRTLNFRMSVPVTHRKPSGRVLMERMGTAMVAGLASSFACEVGMKAILITRLDEAAKTHDLLELYEELPEDSRHRMEADFPSIAGVLKRSRETFGKWRYFEQAEGEDAIRALVDTDRVRGLGKAARVIADECLVAGLNFGIDINTTFEWDWNNLDKGLSQQLHLSLEGNESSVPWEEVLRAGNDTE